MVGMPMKQKTRHSLRQLKQCGCAKYWKLLFSIICTILLNTKSSLTFNIKSYSIHSRQLWTSVKHTRIFQSNSEERSNQDQEGSTRGKGRGHISPEAINQIKASVDIVSLIDSYNLPGFSNLQEGRATALCPFHDDNNPSLQIDSSKGIYKCFSCGAGGDVFGFVREYELLQNGGQKMSFPAAVRKVARDFCDESKLSQVTHDSVAATSSVEMSEANWEKRKRILLINSHAADFYAKLLITSHRGGLARSYLRKRGIVPSIVRTFGLGYAPDTYFNNKSGKGTRTGEWGEGSCVENLKEGGFTPAEIVEAGLATITSSAKARLKSLSESNKSTDQQVKFSDASENKTSTNQTDMVDEEVALQFSDLMDRFRDRLMIPIFDHSGKQVIAFGGRDLSSKSDQAQSTMKKEKYRTAKYLNSPETLVFSKKNVLFGLHGAKTTISEDDIMNSVDEGDATSTPSESRSESQSPSVLIVEGYFDAIVIYGAGIKEVVASMGAALTSTQLRAAVDALGGHGCVMLCLDNDDAGLAATDRICDGTVIWDLLANNKDLQIKIVSLPNGVKDPAEFIETNGGLSKATSGLAFREQVLNEALDWSDWYLSRLISQYNKSISESYSGVCDRVTTFLSKFPDPFDRKKRVYDIADTMTELIMTTKGEGVTNSSSVPFRIQLESDLLGMTSRKASSKKSLTKRIEGRDGILASVTSTIAKLNSGEGTNPDFLDDLRIQPSESKRPRQQSGMDRNFGRKLYRSAQKPGKTINHHGNKAALRDHFSGFQFNPTDAAWLGLSDEKNNKQKQPFVSGPFVNGGKSNNKKKKELVFFNSNKFFGSEMLTQDAYNAGYNRDSRQMNSNDRGHDSVAHQDADRLLFDAEERMLRMMVQFPVARLAMQQATSNRDFLGLIEWSTPEREWLFHCLTNSPPYEELPQTMFECGTPSQLLQYLRDRKDAPYGAFLNSPGETDELDKTNSPGNDETLKNLRSAGNLRDVRIDSWHDPHDCHSDEVLGTLEMFFKKEDDDVSQIELDETSVSHDTRAELTIQETVATMLKATAMKRELNLREKWKHVNEIIVSRQSRMEEKEISEQVDDLSNSNDRSDFDNMSDSELTALHLELSQQVVDAMRVVRELSESASQLNNRLLDFCASDCAEGRISVAKQEELAKMMDAHLAELPDDPRPQSHGDDGEYVFGSDSFDDAIDSRFGGMSEKSTNDDEELITGTDDGEILNFDSIFE